MEKKAKVMRRLGEWVFRCEENSIAVNRDRKREA
jgi:hypothetical protein